MSLNYSTRDKPLVIYSAVNTNTDKNLLYTRLLVLSLSGNGASTNFLIRPCSPVTGWKNGFKRKEIGSNDDLFHFAAPYAVNPNFSYRFIHFYRGNSSAEIKQGIAVCHGPKNEPPT